MLKNVSLALVSAKQLLSSDSLLRPVLVLISGTAVAHLITALALPILTRLYSPSDFSVLAVFSGLMSIISVAACLRFELAIPIPEDETEAFALLVLALISAAFVSLSLEVLALIFPDQIVGFVGQPSLRPFIWLIPFGVMFTGSYGAFQYWSVRKKQFQLIAQSRITQSATASLMQMAWTFTAVSPLGLIIGYMLNSGAACFVLGYRLVRDECSSVYMNRITMSLLKTTWSRYDKFPKFSTWEALANSAAIQIPIIIIAAKADHREAGYLLLAMSIIQAPMALFGMAIGQVYFSNAPAEFRNGNLGAFTKRILFGLIKTGVAPLLLIGMISPFAFGYVFGDGWERAGWLVLWMTPWFIMQFLASPISTALSVTGHLRLQFVLQLFGLVFRTAAVVLALSIEGKPVSEAYAMSGAAFYLVYLILLIKITGTDTRFLIKK